MLSCVLLLAGEALAQTQKTVSAKKYVKEINEFFKGLEIVELQEPPSQMGRDEIILPAFKLRNKTRGDLMIPVDIAPQSAGSSGILGYPVWKFTPLDGGGRRSAVSFGGLTISQQANKIDANGTVEIGAKNQLSMVLKTDKVPAGSYKLSVEFKPHLFGRITEPVGPMTVLSYPVSYKVTVKESSVPGAAASAGEKKSAKSASAKKVGMTPREEVMRANDITNHGKSALMDAVVLDKLELASDTLKPGVPFAFSFVINVADGQTLPDDSAKKPARMAYLWAVTKVGSAERHEAPFARELHVFGQKMHDELRSDKSYAFSGVASLETKSLEPGTYELEVRIWENGVTMSAGSKNTKYALFKVVR